MKIVDQTLLKKYSNKTHDELLDVILKLTFELSCLKKHVYGTRSERYAPDPEGMKLLFTESEEVKVFPPLEELQPRPKRTKKRGKRKPLPSNLPRVETVLDLPENQKKCLVHGINFVKIGEDVSSKIKAKPVSFYIEDTITYRYKCPCCEELNVVYANKIDPIPKSFASPSLLALITTQKYCDGLPLARQERIFQRSDIDLNRTTMSRWMIKMSDLVSPLISLLHEEALDSPILHADETTMQVLKEPNKPAHSKSYLWAIARSGPEPIILFRYYDSRSNRAGVDLLQGFNGILVSDAYRVYDSLQSSIGFRSAGCWAHARRKFAEVDKFLHKNIRGKTDSIASKALKYISRLHIVENEISKLSSQTKLEIRREKSVPLLAALYSWLITNRELLPPKSPTASAINYTLSNWEKLNVFCQNGDVPMTNNYLESHIRPFARGRDAWLFADSVKGATASANLYTLVECAKANGIEPFDYLEFIFKELPYAMSFEDLEKLLPHKLVRPIPLRPYNPSGKKLHFT